MDQVVRSLALGERDLLISVHTAQPPSNEEWGTLVQGLKEAEVRKSGDISQVIMLMIGDGGSPDTLMRDAMNKVLNGRPLRMAAVTDSLVGRGVVTAISWFNPQIRAYAPANGKDAFTHLSLGPDETKQTLDLLGAISRLLPGVASLDTLLASFSDQARPTRL